MDVREQVVAEAMTWLRTPYHHAGRVKGGGVDCATILIEVYAVCGLIENFDPGFYPMDWMLHRDEERYLGFVLERAKRVENPLPGDVLVFKIGRTFSHSAIVVDMPLCIHAHRDDGVTLVDVSKDFAGRQFQAFSVI